MSRIRASLTSLGVMTANPWAFAVVVIYGIAWFAFDRAHFGWTALATLLVWAMTLVIQRAEQRDTQAIHAKLDELLRAHGRADNSLEHADQEEPEKIEQEREKRQRNETSFG